MRTNFILSAGAASVALLTSLPAGAVNVTVDNYDFSIHTAFNVACGAGCAYTEAAIPGWTKYGYGAMGIVQWGAPANTAHFAYTPTPDVAFSNGGSLLQVVGPTAIAGATYTLTSEVGLRKDGLTYAATSLDIGYVGATAVSPYTSTTTGFGSAGQALNSGTWETETAVYKVLPTQAGLPIEIQLDNILSTAEGNWTNIKLSYTLPTPTPPPAVPEPATWAMLLAGFGVLGAVMRRSRRMGSVAA